MPNSTSLPIRSVSPDVLLPLQSCNTTTMSNVDLLLQQWQLHHHQRNKVNNTSNDGFLADTTVLGFPTPEMQSSNRNNKRWKLSTSIFNIDYQQLQSKEEQQLPLQNLGNGNNKTNLLQLNHSEITTSIHHPLPQRSLTNVGASPVCREIYYYSFVRLWWDGLESVCEYIFLISFHLHFALWMISRCQCI
jgi:hypothetical protein